MLVEVIVDRLQYVGKRGAVKDIPANQARVLIALGKVVAAQQIVAAAEAEPSEPIEKPRRRRQYRRRDMTAVVAELSKEVDSDE